MTTTKEMLQIKIDGYEEMLYKKCNKLRELIAEDKDHSDEAFQLRRDIYELDMILCTLCQELHMLDR